MKALRALGFCAALAGCAQAPAAPVASEPVDNPRRHVERPAAVKPAPQQNPIEQLRRDLVPLREQMTPPPRPPKAPDN